MNYNDITAAAKLYADRQDLEVSDNIDTFILMAESRINRLLKTMDQTHRIYTNTFGGQEYYSLPEEYNGMRSIQFNSGDADASKVITLEYVTPETIATMQQSSHPEQKHYYTIVSNQIQLHSPLPGGGTIEIVFYRKVPNLTATEKTNWLSEDYPDIYIAGILTEIELFVKNYDIAKTWDAKMSRSIEELKSVDIENRWAGNSLTMRAG